MWGWGEYGPDGTWSNRDRLRTVAIPIDNYGTGAGESQGPLLHLTVHAVWVAQWAAREHAPELWAQLASWKTAGNEHDPLWIVTCSMRNLDAKANVFEYGAHDERKVTHREGLLISEQFTLRWLHDVARESTRDEAAQKALCGNPASGPHASNLCGFVLLEELRNETRTHGAAHVLGAVESDRERPLPI